MGTVPSHEVAIETVQGASKTKEDQFNKVDEQAKKPVEEPKKVPHSYEAIMKEADNPSIGSLDDHIYSGIFLNDKRKKYWVDAKSGNNCFVLFARNLSITWSENQRYWHWFPLKDTSEVEIEAASLLNVCWLEVHGWFDVSYLTPAVLYEVVFVVMMKEPTYGWCVPVNLKLICADGSVQERKEILYDKPREQWIELMVGEFMTNVDKVGEMQFSLYDYEGGKWKRGLILKGVIIRPKK